MKSLLFSLLTTVLLVAFPAAARQQLPLELSSIEGTVLDDATGMPIPGVTVGGPLPPGLTLQEIVVGRIKPPLTQSDADGHFLLDNLREGRVPLDFNKEGYAARTVIHTVNPGQHLKGIQIRISALGVVSGQLFDKNGQPAVKVVVTAFRYTFSRGFRELISVIPGTLTNDRGEFRLLDILPDRYFINFAPTPIGWGEEALPDPIATPPTLYPGVGDLSKAEIVEVKSGEETRLDVVTLRTRKLNTTYGEPSRSRSCE